MRIISWSVVVASLTAIAWLGAAPLLGGLKLPLVDAEQAVGTVVTRPQGASVAVRQPATPEQGCARTGTPGKGTEQETTAPTTEPARENPGPCPKP